MCFGLVRIVWICINSQFTSHSIHFDSYIWSLGWFVHTITNDMQTNTFRIHLKYYYGICDGLYVERVLCILWTGMVKQTADKLNSFFEQC